jgi:hypothetical protein
MVTGTLPKMKYPFSINLKNIEVYFALKLKVKNHFLVKKIKEIDKNKKVNEFLKIKRNSRIMFINQMNFPLQISAFGRFLQ